MFVVDADDRLVTVDETLTSLVDAAPADLSGTALTASVADEDRATISAVLSSVRSTRDPVSRTCACRLDGGDAQVPVELELGSTSAGTATDEVVGFVREGDDDRRFEANRASARERFGHLFDLIQDAVVEFEMVDGKPIVRSVNPAFVEVFGYDRERVIGESLNEYIVPAERSGQADDYDRRTADGKVNYAVVTRETVDGSREFLYQGLPYTGEDGGRYGFAIYSDISEQRQQQRRLRVLHRVLRHNLRNDLTVVLGMAEEVLRVSNDTRVRSAAADIVDNAESLAALSEKSLLVERALDRSDRGDVDAAAIARSVADEFRSRSDVELSTPESASVAAGAGLHDAITALVENAVEHTPDGTPVRLTVVHRDEEVQIRVIDEGPGIPDVERAAVFEDRDITSLRHGSGLGIWLARWVAEAAGGRISHERADGRTTVTIHVPSRDATGRRESVDD